MGSDTAGGATDTDTTRAIRATRRLIAVGQRPLFHVALQASRARIVELPGITVAALTRRAALHAARTRLALELECADDAFDVVVLTKGSARLGDG